MDAISQCIKKIEEVARKFGIRYVILFGSFAHKTSTEESDIDIAIKLKTKDKKEAVRILKELAILLPDNIDIVLINFAPFSLLYEIYTKGKLIYCENKEEFYEDAFKVVKKYEDWKKIARVYEKREMMKVMK